MLVATDTKRSGPQRRHLDTVAVKLRIVATTEQALRAAAADIIARYGAQLTWTGAGALGRKGEWVRYGTLVVATES